MSTAAELVHQARALKRVYQQTWRLEDVEAQIHCYLGAIDLICETSKNGEPFCASVTPPTSSVAEEPFEEKEGGQRTCAIGACLCIATERHPPNASFAQVYNRWTSHMCYVSTRRKSVYLYPSRNSF